MKRFVTSILFFVLLINSFQVFATTVSLQIDNPYMTVDGVKCEIDPGVGTVPVVSGGRTLVPIRAIIEAFGGTVGWNGETREATLSLGSDCVMLTIDSFTAYFNGDSRTLDVAPVIIGGRTMLPLRFVSECFGLEVLWDDATKTVVISDEDKLYIPPYNGAPYVAVNNNLPLFSEEITDVSFEKYSPLDYLGRCGVCIASVGVDIMPTEDRGSISSVTPSGWHSISYDNVDGGYLYNRCHLIGYQLTAENANENNLITGTRHMNVDGMLPFENMVADYVKETGNHVMYRATPFFTGDNLVADGVLLEGYSVEDNGAGILFCVYCYNVQPGVIIDYSDGSSSQQFVSENTTEMNSTGIISTGVIYVLNTSSKKFHYPDCGSAKRIKAENYMETSESREYIINLGYTPCGNCNP